MSSRSVVISGWATVVGGFALMAVHYYAGSPGDPEGWFSAVGFGAPFAGAGGLALVGDRAAKPLLCVAGGIGLGIMSLVSVVLFPLLIAAGFMIAAARNVSMDGDLFAVPAALATGLVVVFGFLVFHQDPVTWSSAEGGGSSSNIVTNLEASISLSVVTVVLLGSILWSRQSTERTHTVPPPVDLRV